MPPVVAPPRPPPPPNTTQSPAWLQLSPLPQGAPLVRHRRATPAPRAVATPASQAAATPAPRAAATPAPRAAATPAPRAAATPPRGLPTRPPRGPPTRPPRGQSPPPPRRLPPSPPRGPPTHPPRGLPPRRPRGLPPSPPTSVARRPPPVAATRRPPDTRLPFHRPPAPSPRAEWSPSSCPQCTVVGGATVPQTSPPCARHQRPPPPSGRCRPLRQGGVVRWKPNSTPLTHRLRINPDQYWAAVNRRPPKLDPIDPVPRQDRACPKSLLRISNNAGHNFQEGGLEPIQVGASEDDQLDSSGARPAHRCTKRAWHQTGLRGPSLQL